MGYYLDLLRYILAKTIILVSCIIVPGIIVSVAISIVQSATQINEQSLSFIPKLLITIGTLIVISPWLIQQMLDLTNYVWINLGAIK